MKFRDYIDQLTSFAIKNPESLDYDVIYSCDSEGNYFEHVYFSPSVGFYLDGNLNTESETPNSICIN